MEFTSKEIWNVESLRLFFIALHHEIDKRYEQKFQAQEQAIAVASSASDKRLDGLNEIRKMAQDQQDAHAKYISLYIPRLEAMSQIDNLKDKIQIINSRLDLGTANNVGAEKSKDSTKWWVAIVVSAIPGLIALFAIFQQRGI